MPRRHPALHSSLAARLALLVRLAGRVLLVLGICATAMAESGASTSARQGLTAPGDPFRSARGNVQATAAEPAFGQRGRFLPVEQAYRLQPIVLQGQLLLHWEIAPGYYLYRHGFDARTSAGQKLGLDLPDGVQRDDPYFGRVEVYYDSVEAEASEISADPFEVTVISQGCADAGLCYPPHSERWRIDPAAGSAALVAASAASPAAPAARAAASGKSWAAMLAFAVAGGALLNLMPCVFPVLGLKALSFRAAPGGALTHGLSYTAGVMLSVVLLAALLLTLRAGGLALGWGFQLQHPVFVGGLVYLFFALGLSLSGVWRIGAGWMGLGQRWTERQGLAGSFFTGVLATVVASPCTAPLMGTAMGFALLQPAGSAVAIFAALGFGMALPLLLLSASARLQRWLPRPGPWMERAQQALAFPLYASAIWLSWVLGRQTGTTGMATVLSGALVIALGLWLLRFGTAGRIAGAACAGVALSLLVSGPLEQARPSPAPASSNAQPYSAAALARLRASETPVLLNATADWCLTCIANERVALASTQVQRALAEQGVVYMEADWTHYDAAITRLLGEFGRGGVPLYVFYPAGGSPRVLPQLLTPATVLRAIDNGAREDEGEPG